MSYLTKVFCGVTLILVPTIQYGGYFLLQLLSGRYSSLELTEFQRAMFRAGHAHAGVLVILSLIAQILIEHASLASSLELFLRFGFPLSAILISGGFFGGSIGPQITEPTKLIYLLYIGIGLLALCLVILGISLIKNK